MKEPKDILQQYVGDMLAVDRHIRETIRRQRDDKLVQADADAHKVLERAEAAFDTIIAELEQHLEQVGGSATSPIKDAVSTAVGAVGSVYDKIRSEPVSKMLRDDYTALGLAAISYTQLNTTGHALNSPATAQIAARHLRQITPLITGISKIMPLVVARELAQDNFVDSSAASLSVTETQQAWSADITNQNIFA